MKKNIAEFGPFNQPSPENDDEAIIGRGRNSREQQPVITDPSEYRSVLDRALREIKRPMSFGRQRSTIRADIESEAQNNGKQFYVDALLSARGSFRIKHYKIADQWIEKPPFIVHAYAVANMLDDRGVEPLASAEDRAGYYISAGSRDASECFFVRTKDRHLIKQMYDELVRACSYGDVPEQPLDALHRLFQEYQNGLRQPKAEVVWKGGLPRGQIPGATIYYTPQYDSFTEEGKEQYKKGRRISWNEYDARKGELMGYARQRVAPDMHDSVVKKDEQEEYYGNLPERREQAERKIFIHEHISAFPGGVFVRTYAIRASGRRTPLRTPSDISAYITEIGLKPHQRRIKINSLYKDVVKKIHTDIFNRLKRFEESIPRKQFVDHIIRDVEREYNREQYTPLIELLKG